MKCWYFEDYFKIIEDSWSFFFFFSQGFERSRKACKLASRIEILLHKGTAARLFQMYSEKKIFFTLFLVYVIIPIFQTG